MEPLATVAISIHLIIGLRDCFVAVLLAMTNCGAVAVIASDSEAISTKCNQRDEIASSL
jgi:hypothetical protein